MTSGRLPPPPPSTELPPSVLLERGEGGQPCLRVAGRGGSAEIYLQGAHLTSWQPAGQEPVIWMSRASAFSPGAPIRGGIPICFPWFGPNVRDAAAPLHGFARLHDWTLVGAGEVGDDVSLTFELRDSEQTRSTAWPYRFDGHVPRGGRDDPAAFAGDHESRHRSRGLRGGAAHLFRGG